MTAEEMLPGNIIKLQTHVGKDNATDLSKNLEQQYFILIKFYTN